MIVDRATKAIQDHVDVDDRDEVPVQDSIGRMQKRRWKDANSNNNNITAFISGECVLTLVYSKNG